MKILYLASIDVSKFGAPAVHVQGTCRSFRALGHKVILLSSKSKLNWLDSDQEYETKVYWPDMRGGWRIFQFLAGRRLKKIIVKWNPDLIYLRFSPSKYIARILKTSDIPVALELNGEESIESRHFHHMLDVANLVLVDDQHLKTLITEKFPIQENKVNLHLSPVTDTNFFIPLDNLVCRDYLGLDRDAFVIIHTSSFQIHHDFNTIEIAFREFVKTNRRKSILVLLGDGPMKSIVMKKMEDLISESLVYFPGMMPIEVLHRYINAADVTIDLLTSKKLNAGRSLTAFKLFEYAACNRPVITAVAKDFIIPKWADDSFNIIESENSSALVSALSDIKSNPAVWHDRAIKGGDYVRLERSLDAGTKTTISHLEKLF